MREEFSRTELLYGSAALDKLSSSRVAVFGVGGVGLNPEKAGLTCPKGIFGWDGAAGSCITMDTASKTSFAYTQHVRNMGVVYGEVHPKLRDMVF